LSTGQPRTFKVVLVGFHPADPFPDADCILALALASQHWRNIQPAPAPGL